MASIGLLEPGLEPQGCPSSRHRVSQDLDDSSNWDTTSSPLFFGSLRSSTFQSLQAPKAHSPTLQLLLSPSRVCCGPSRCPALRF